MLNFCVQTKVITKQNNWSEKFDEVCDGSHCFHHCSWPLVHQKNGPLIGIKWCSLCFDNRSQITKVHCNSHANQYVKAIRSSLTFLSTMRIYIVKGAEYFVLEMAQYVIN